MHSDRFTEQVDPEIDDVSERLRLAGLELPAISTNGNYQLVAVAGSMVFTAGQLSRRDGQVIGRLDGIPTLHLLREAAHVCALRAVAAMANAVDLNQIKRLISMTGYIANGPDFVEHSAVMDAASDTLLAIFGTHRGAHVRTAVGVASLPAGGLVEIKLSAHLRS